MTKIYDSLGYIQCPDYREGHSCHSHIQPKRGRAEIHSWALHVQIWDIVKGFLLGCDISFSHPLLLNIYPRVRVSGSHSIVSSFLQAHGLQPTRLLCPWNFPDKNTGVGSYSLLQGIFLTQGSNLSPLHCRQILYHLSCLGSPRTEIKLGLISSTNSDRLIVGLIEVSIGTNSEAISRLHSDECLD